MTSDVSRWWDISRIKTADGEMSDNLEAISETGGGHQLHCDLKNVLWSNVIDKFRKLPPVPDIIGGGERSRRDFVDGTLILPAPSGPLREH
jgi:hypothetical protein